MCTWGRWRLFQWCSFCGHILLFYSIYTCFGVVSHSSQLGLHFIVHIFWQWPIFTGTISHFLSLSFPHCVHLVSSIALNHFHVPFYCAILIYWKILDSMAAWAWKLPYALSININIDWWYRVDIAMEDIAANPVMCLHFPRQWKFIIHTYYMFCINIEFQPSNNSIFFFGGSLGSVWHFINFIFGKRQTNYSIPSRGNRGGGSFYFCSPFLSQPITNFEKSKRRQ